MSNLQKDYIRQRPMPYSYSRKVHPECCNLQVLSIYLLGCAIEFLQD